MPSPNPKVAHNFSFHKQGNITHSQQLHSLVVVHDLPPVFCTTTSFLSFSTCCSLLLLSLSLFLLLFWSDRSAREAETPTTGHNAAEAARAATADKDACMPSDSFILVRWDMTRINLAGTKLVFVLCLVRFLRRRTRRAGGLCQNFGRRSWWFDLCHLSFGESRKHAQDATARGDKIKTPNDHAQPLLLVMQSTHFQHRQRILRVHDTFFAHFVPDFAF